MTREQATVWAAVQVQLRRGGSVEAGVERCRQAGIAVRVVRHYLGRPEDPQFGQAEAIHRMVAAAFIGPKPTAKHQVNHIDANKQNNRVVNLEWVTPRGNIRHAMRNGLSPKNDTHGSRKLTIEIAENIRRRAELGESGASLAREYGVTRCAVYHILNGRTWNSDVRRLNERGAVE